MKCSVLSYETLTRSSRGNDGSKDHTYNDSDILHLLLLYLSLLELYTVIIQIQVLSVINDFL